MQRKTNSGRSALVALAAGIAIAAVLLTVPAAVAQGGAPPYDKKTEMTLKGAIVEVKPVQTQSGVEGMHLMMVDAAKKPIEVFAGPSPFIASLGATFAKGEMVEIIGSKQEINGIAALVARQIKKGGKTFDVRDADGKPAWGKKQ